MKLSTDEKQKLDKAISVTDKVKAGKARKDAITYIVKLAKEKTGNYPRTLKQALYFLDYLDESINENKLDERIKIFDPIMNKLKDKADFIRNKGKYTKLGKYFEYIISDSIKNIKKFNYFYVGDDEEGENLKRQVPKLRKSLGNYSSLKVNLSGSDESKLKKYLYDSFRDGILDGRGEDMDRDDVDFYIAHWLMDNGFTTPYVFGESKSVKEQLTFQQFQDKSAELNKKTSELGKVLNSFPKGEMGMVKQTPEVKKIKKEFDILFKELQNLNKKYVKIYKKELQKARADKRMKRQTKESVNEAKYSLSDLIAQVKTFDKPKTQKLLTVKVINKLKEKRNKSKSNKEKIQKIIDKIESDYKKGKYLESVNEEQINEGLGLSIVLLTTALAQLAMILSKEGNPDNISFKDVKNNWKTFWAHRKIRKISKRLINDPQIKSMVDSNTTLNKDGKITGYSNLIGIQKILKNKLKPDEMKYLKFGWGPHLRKAAGYKRESFESVNEAMDNVDKVLYFIKKEIKRGYLNRLKVDEDEIIAVASKYKIRLNDDEVDEIISMIDTEDNIFESVNEISFSEMERIDAIQKDIKSHIAKNYKDEIKQKKDRWMKSYSDLVGHSGKGLNKKNLKNIVKLAKQKNDKKLLQMVASLSESVKESVNEKAKFIYNKNQIILKKSDLGTPDSWTDKYNRAWREFVVRYIKQNNIKAKSKSDAEYKVKKAFKIPYPEYKYNSDSAYWLEDNGFLVIKESLRQHARDQDLFRTYSFPKTFYSDVVSIAGLTGTDATVVDDFINTHNIDAKKLYNFVRKLKHDDRLKFAKTFKSAVTGKANNKEFKMITKQFSESVNEARMKEDDFIDRLEDYASEVIPFKDYIKKSTRDILKQLIGSMRTDKKAKALYTYWSKNKREDLLDRMRSIFESVNEEQIDEKLITFSNRAPYGQIVFMAGGAGSGKGFAISNFIDSAGFKVRDVDEMKKAVGKLDQLGKFSVDKWYKKFSGNLSADARKHVEEFVIGKGLSIADISNDLKNPNNVAALHFIVDAMGIKDKWLISMLKGKKNKETLPNLLFDITAKKVGSITSVIKPLLANGYDAKNIHLIWVLTDYHVAVSQNKERERVVPDDILLKTHEGAAKTIWDILTKALPSGLNGRIDVILNNRENTVTYKDADGDTLKGAIKGFLSLPIKKQGGGILPEKIWLDKLYKWVSDNGPKTVDLQKPLDAQLESVNEAQKSPAAKMVLQLMDKDPDGGGNYEVALKKALTKFKNVNKAELEKELDLYI